MVLVSGWAGCAFDIRDMCNCMVEEEHEILNFYKGWMLLLPYFQFKSIYIYTIFKLKTCVYIWRLVSCLLLEIYFLEGFLV